MKKLMLAAAALVAMPAMASAAPATPVDWSGYYAGLTVGYDFGHVKVDDLDGYNGPPAIKYDPDGVNIALQGGYNWVVGSDWVLGLEGELGWFGFQGKQQYPPYIGVRLPTDSRASVNGRFLATATGRVGYAIGSWLLFAKGGYAGSDIKVAYIDADPTGTTLVGGTSKAVFKSGYTGGAGIEYMFPSGHMSTRIEYDYYDFGHINEIAQSAGGTLYGFRHEITSNVVKVSVTFHW